MTETQREAFEAYFLDSRKSKRKPNFARLPDGTYADDHTQRHWWTWQKALLYLEQAGAAVSDADIIDATRHLEYLDFSGGHAYDVAVGRAILALKATACGVA